MKKLKSNETWNEYINQIWYNEQPSNAIGSEGNDV